MVLSTFPGLRSHPTVAHRVDARDGTDLMVQGQRFGSPVQSGSERGDPHFFSGRGAATMRGGGLCRGTRLLTRGVRRGTVVVVVFVLVIREFLNAADQSVDRPEVPKTTVPDNGV